MKKAHFLTNLFATEDSGNEPPASQREARVLYIWVQYSIQFPRKKKRKQSGGNYGRERTPGSEVFNDEGGRTNQKERSPRMKSGRGWVYGDGGRKNKAKV